MRLWTIVRRDSPDEIHGALGALLFYRHRDHAEREVQLTMRHPEEWIVVPVDCEIRSAVGEAQEAMEKLAEGRG